ncbi:MAG: helix-turn-helix domain-containing protein [Microthrixaceae bacterium]|nr:helix-turn-helix domain-containing protein [Acidimicrobiales bacterium]MCB9403757.1 helix-turn-helix domain-containing protein [Microthrixaceae bacterium]
MDDVPAELSDFLTSRRARITPEMAGLPAFGRNRRVKGLRREEVALLAGISVEYFTRLERGKVGSASDDVLDAVARALQLDTAERAHLFDLARQINTTRTPRRPAKQERVRPTVQQIIHGLVDHPAYVRNARLDVLATNPLGAALYAPLFDSASRPVNIARFVFLDPHAAEFFTDWDTIANDSVAILRAEAGRDPYDRRLSDLVGELSTRSDDFRVRWAAHNVQLSCATVKHLHHPLVGDLTLTYEALHLPNDAGQRILVYAAEPASRTAEALGLLASWAAQPREAATEPSDTHPG